MRIHAENFEMLKIALIDQRVILSILTFWCVHTHISWYAHGQKYINRLTHDLQLMCIKFDLFMMSGYKDMIDVIFKNGHKAASRLIDHAEKGN